MMTEFSFFGIFFGNKRHKSFDRFVENVTS